MIFFLSDIEKPAQITSALPAPQVETRIGGRRTTLTEESHEPQFPSFQPRQPRSLCRTNDFLTFELANQIENRKARTPGDVGFFANLP
jgi:hypothetical protein